METGSFAAALLGQLARRSPSFASAMRENDAAPALVSQLALAASSSEVSSFAVSKSSGRTYRACFRTRRASSLVSIVPTRAEPSSVSSSDVVSGCASTSALVIAGNFRWNCSIAGTGEVHMLVSGSEALFEDGTRTSRPSSRLPSASKCNATVFSESPASACERSAISDARFGDGEIADSRNAEDARVRRWAPPQKSQKTVKSRPRIDAPPGFRYPRPHLATGGPRAPCPRPGVCGCASRKLLASLLRNFGLENDATMPRLGKGTFN